MSDKEKEVKKEKKEKSNKKLKKLPKKIISLKNPDKLFHERWYKNRNLLNIPHPFRAIICGPPNSGKTLIIKNILLRARPEYKRLYLLHCDGNYTKEYDDIDIEVLEELPSPDEWEGEEKAMVILDDVDYQAMNKEQSKNLNRLFGFCSTHKNISICLTSQNYFDIPPAIKRMSNFFILWKNIDSDTFKMIARKCGMKLEDFQYIFKNVIGNDPHDSLWIDLTDKSPAKLRKNGFEVISGFIHK